MLKRLRRWWRSWPMCASCKTCIRMNRYCRENRKNYATMGLHEQLQFLDEVLWNETPYPCDGPTGYGGAMAGIFNRLVVLHAEKDPGCELCAKQKADGPRMPGVGKPHWQASLRPGP